MKISEALQSQTNDYSELDVSFFEQTGRHLYETIKEETPLKDEFPSISVVIPCFNAGDTIDLVLQALDAQNYPSSDLEVLLVDDGSTDETLTILDRVAPKLTFDCRLITHCKNSGRSSARNTGARAAHNELLLFLDADAIAPPGLLLSHAVKHSFCNDLLLISMKERVPLTSDLREKLLADQFNFTLSPEGDWRYYGVLEIDGEDVPISNVTETDFFKGFGEGFKYYAKTLPEMVISVCLSVGQEYFYKIGGFCEHFITYGREDVFFGAMAVSQGLFVIPDLNVLYQLDDQGEIARKSDKKAEHVVSVKLYQELLEKEVSQIAQAGQHDLELASERIAQTLVLKEGQKDL